MCHQGVCGVCIVMVRAYRQTSGTIETFSVNSCLVLALSCNGWEITTIEGVGNRKDGYSDVQKRIAALNGTQCGYCTPGWVMQMHSLLHKNLTMSELEDSFGSNTCRCTGYRPILDTIKSFASDANKDLCSKVKDIEDLKICPKSNRKCSIDSNSSDWCLLNYECVTSNEIICINYKTEVFFKVYTVDQILQVIRENGSNFMLVDGNTAKGVIKNFQYPKILIDISDVTSLKQYTFEQNFVVGANTSIQDCITIFSNEAKTREQFQYFEQFVKHLELVAHIPVRKIGSLAGNMMIKHNDPTYQSDIFLLFEAVGATVTVCNSNGNSKVLSLPAFLQYDMKNSLILNFKLPPQGKNHIFKSYKIISRNQNALAIVNAAFYIKINPNTSVFEETSIVYGNISGSFIHANKTEKYITGKNVFNTETLQSAIKILDQEIDPAEEPVEATPKIRKKLAIGLFYKFILSICPQELLSSRYSSGGTLISRPLSSGKQYYQTDKDLYPLNQPVQKLEAVIQSSGEAQYVNDIPMMYNQVFAAFVLSKVCKGKVDLIDIDDIVDHSGFIAFFTPKDIPGVNSFTYPSIYLQTEDEEIMASDNIKFYGQPVAIVVANSEQLAAELARKVKVTYKSEDSKPVLTIDEAKEDKDRYMAGGDDATIKPKGKGTDGKTVIKGKYEIEAQYHYYMEPLSCVVIPVDTGLEVYSTTQWMDLVQIGVARCLKIKESDVHVMVRRIGGGFGGKISRNNQVATACALVASKLDRPCRFILPIETNLDIAGRRLPSQLEYEVSVDENGKIQYLNATIIEDDGCSHNENILSYTKDGFKNCYNYDNFSLNTGAVVTDLPSNTFARAPGTAEGIAAIEHIMERIAFTLQIDPTKVRLANMTNEDNDLPSLIEILKNESDYEKREDDIKQFNKDNRWIKKAINLFVMSFPVTYYGNYSALVSIYRGDGTVTVTMGGVEMGQGVNTKAAQVCAYELKIPLDYVTIIPNYSFVAANNVFSGSSIVSESVCYAIIKCCKTLNDRLQPVREEMKNATWLDVVQKAGNDEIDLVAEYMMNDTEPDLEGYNAFAVTICEVEVDVLTGRYQINRVDILEDVGLSTNPTIDVGQVEGAYVQGLSYNTLEKFKYNIKTGELLNDRAINYEVYLAKDIPVDFRIKLRFNSKNPKGVLGSKAVGEMGICTSFGICYALRGCIMASRADSGYKREWIDIDFPCDPEAILKALDVKLSELTIS
ncbi:unnamed protein product [Leptidea sinapis]|uniref:FAD-binding PCMH-type domain-containing protein n=2 Tax=Leptidea sinapis TaxID=189913 RepID=A0A5E4QIS4_9NEOP|nr:unnamed protein product [Leptidea sinapis]